MMLTRAWRADFDLSDSEGRIISGIAVPFNSPTVIAERGRVFEETWKPGSTKETTAKRGDRMRLLGFHDQRTWPIGKPVAFEEQARGLIGTFRISDTRDGNDALTLIRDGVLDGLSVGFGIPEGGDTWNLNETQRTITRAEIQEVSLVNFPAFDRARVESVRSARDDGSVGHHNPFDAHQFDDNGGTGQCVVCNLTDDEGNHGLAPTEENSATPDLSVRYQLEVARLELLRLELI